MKREQEGDPCEGRCGVSRREALKLAVRGGMVYVFVTRYGARASAAPAWVKVGAVTQFKTGVPKKVTLKPGVTAFVVRQQILVAFGNAQRFSIELLLGLVVLILGTVGVYLLKAYSAR